MISSIRIKAMLTHNTPGANAGNASAKRPCLPCRRLRLEPLEDRRLLSVPGLFSDSGQNLGNSLSNDVALGDLDGDGDLDAYVANNGPNMVWINDGFGRFSDSGQRLGNSYSCRVALGDVDSDGDLDAVVANSTTLWFGEPNRVYLNDGAGLFTDSGQELGLEESSGVDLGDVDGDGDLDAFFANGSGYRPTLFFNDGQGSFTDSGQVLGTSCSMSVGLGDLDGDGDLDAFVGKGEYWLTTQYTEVLLNDGAGTFTDSGQRLGGDSVDELALADLDGDGDLDAFCACTPNRVWLNDGLGHFTDSGQLLGLERSYGLGVGDLDTDGDLDAFVVTGGDQPDRVFLNNGTGVFADSGQSLGNWDGRGGDLGDLDGDGDLDAFVANKDQPDKVLVNQTLGAGITVNYASAPITTEFGLAFEFSVVLNSQPTADVTVGISSSDTTEGTVSPSPLTFTALNWDVPQTVSVTPVDDALEDGDVIYSILIGPAQSADPWYNGMIPPGDLVLSNLDDEQLVTATPTTGLRTTERGGTATFTVVLDWQPAADVTFGLSSSDTTEGIVSPSQLTFTQSNWNIPQTVTVTGVCDWEEDGDRSYLIQTAPIVSSDPLFDGMDPPDVQVTNENVQVQSIPVPPGVVSWWTGDGDATDLVGPNEGTLVNGAGYAAGFVDSGLAFDGVDDMFQAPAEGLPTGNQDRTLELWVKFDSFPSRHIAGYGNLGGVDQSYGLLVGAENENRIGFSQGGSVLWGPVLLANQWYHVAVTNTGNTETLYLDGVAVATGSLAINTPSGGQVYVGRHPFDSGSTDGLIDEVSVYNRALWGEEILAIYRAGPAGKRKDHFEITVSPTENLATTEAGGTATFTVALNALPTAEVTIGLSSSDTSEGTVSPAALVFTAANWMTPQTVTVTGVDDDIEDGHVAYTIVTAAAVSGDAKYNGVDPADVTLTNINDDGGLLWYTLLPSGLAPHLLAKQGYSVATSADYRVCGVPYAAVGGYFEAGAVKVYSAATNSIVATLENPAPAECDRFGWSVAVSGNYVAIGTYLDDTGARDAGAVYVYDLASATPTTPIAILSSPAPEDAGWFGYSVAISGNYVVVGEERSFTYHGKAYVYDLASATPTIPIAELNHSSPNTDDCFGWSVAVSGNIVVVGADSVSGGASHAGSAYVYDLGSATPAMPIATLSNPTPASSDNFGWSVAVSGNYVVIGAYQDDTGASDSGSAYVYNLASATPTTPIATLSNPTPAAGDRFGCSVGVSGNYVVVGAYQDDTGATDAGSAYVYDLASATPTTPIATLNNPRPDAGDYFGFSVAVSENCVVAGAYQDDTLTYDAGSSYVYDLASATPAAPIATLNDPCLPGRSVQFGTSVAASGDYVVVGASNDGTGTCALAGSAYVYSLASATPPAPVAILNNPTPAFSDRFGSSVAVSGNYVVVGAYQDDTGVTDAGSAYVYDLASATPAMPVTTLNNPTPASTDNFGRSVAVWGNYVVIGAYQDDTGATNAGSAYVYDLASATPTTPIVTLNNPAPAGDDRFGYSVAAWGNYVVVGAYQDDAGATDAGSVYIYDLASATPAIPIVILANPAPAAGDNFGSSVAVSGNCVAVGAPLDDTVAADAGSAYLYDLASPTPAVPIAMLNNPAPSANDRFGCSVAVSGNRVAVGAYYDDTEVTDTGSAYVYDLTSATPTSPIVTLNNPTPADRDEFGSAVAISGSHVVVGAPFDDTQNYNQGAAYILSYHITVNPLSGLVTTETGVTASFTVVLNTQPTADVTIGLSSSDTSEGTVFPANLTFTPANWNTPQTVTVTGVDDTVLDGNIAYTIITANAASDDVTYNHLVMPDVSVTNIDDDLKDFGDAPFPYPTRLANDGARHVGIGPTLGTNRDTEADGQPTTAADGDDTAGMPDDEDGLGPLLLATSSLGSTTATVTVDLQNADPSSNRLDAWIDFNHDGDWADPGEQIFASYSLATTNGSQTLSFTVPQNTGGNIACGVTYARFRLSTTGGLSPTGYAANGEVEDCQVFITWFGPPGALNSNAGSDSGNDNYAQVTTDGVGNWVAVWQSTDSLGGTIGTDSDILVARSTDAGAAWTAPVALNTNARSDSGYDGVPQVATDGAGNWVAVWRSEDSLGGTIGTDSDILVARSTDAGLTWTAPVALNTNAGSDSGDDRWPQLTTDEAGNWIAVWQSADSLGGTIGTDTDILMARSTNAGLTWTAPVALNTNAGSDAGSDDTPQVTTDGLGNWVAIWTSTDSLGGTIGADADILMARSTDAGITWTAPVALNTNAAVDSGSDSAPQVTTDGVGNWIAVWSSDDSLGETIGTDTDILTARSTDAGATWTAPVGLNANGGSDSGSDGDPQVTTDGLGNWIAVWKSNDSPGGTIGTDDDLLMARSTNIGLTWTVPVPLNTNAAFDSGYDYRPQLTTDALGNWVAVWHSNDSLGGTIGTDYDILFAAFTVSNVMTAGITVTPVSGLVTTETGGAASFSVVLNGRPTADVTIGLSSSDTTEGTVSPTSLTFTTANWNTPQTVTITGQNDDINDGDIAYTIVTAAAVSSDPDYNGLDVADVSITNQDDDKAGITVSAITGNTTEAGGTATFTVVLDSEPTADVTIAVISSDTSEGTVVPIQLIFTPEQWNHPQSVTVAGVNDDVDDGDVGYTITTAASSQDSHYSGMGGTTVAVTNTDDDTAGVTVTPTSGLTTTESGGTATFAVRLDTEPTADVTIELTSSNAGEGTVWPTSLTFTATNWNTPQTATVTGVDDIVDDGDAGYMIVTSNATSSDANYSGFNPADIDVVNLDDDLSVAYLTGTVVNDTILVWLGTAGTSLHEVRVNGTVSTYNPAVYGEIHIDALGGSDRITIYGTDGGESAILRPGSVDVSGPGYVVYAVNVETITVDAGLGDDQVTMTGSINSNRLYSYADYSRLIDSTGSFSHRVEGFETLTVDVSGGGANIAYFYDTPGNDELVAEPGLATLTRSAGSAAETETTAIGFQQVYAYATDGDDTADLTASNATQNRFYCYADYSLLTEARRSFYFYARGFGSVTATSPASQPAYAYLYDSPGIDAFEASTTSASMHREDPWSDTIATGFARIYAYSTAGGADTAVLNGSSTGGNDYRGYPAYSTLYDSTQSFYHYVRGFHSVTAVGSKDNPSSDRAYLYDSSGDDTFNEAFLEESKYQGGSLTDAAGSYELWIKYFDLVYARSTDSGTNDTIAVEDEELLAYRLLRMGTW